MMNLEDEKKRVAEWMGWEIRLDDEHLGAFSNMKQEFIDFYKNWKPQSERKWWDEIWERLSVYDLDYVYTDNVQKFAHAQETRGLATKWYIHTAKPEVCWKALLKTLKEAE